VALHLFQDPEVPPGEVGEKCFDNTLEKARR
jgi:hypothetical protein